MKKIILFLACFGFFQYVLLGHVVPVHQSITFNAAQTAHDTSSGYRDFIDGIDLDLSYSHTPGVTNSLVQGSGFEDNIDEPGDAGKKRSYNHFYDPLDNVYGNGLSDSPPDRRVLTGVDSFNWSSISNCVGYDFYGAYFVPIFGKNVNTHNDWTWQNARGYEWLGLTATNQSERQTNLLSMFRAVGQVMHLLEDASQPQHVRNEQHLDQILGRDTEWRSPIEDWGSTNVANLNYGDGSILDWRGLGFTKLEDFWDRHLYNGSYTALNNDAHGVASAQLGLAEFVNGNFLGDRHSYAEYFKPSSIKYYPYPSRNVSTDYHTKKAYLLSGSGNYMFHNGYQGKGIYLRKNDAGITVQHHSRFTYEGVMRPEKTFPKATTIRDENVLKDYHDILIPKAVEYSAGLLDYYFRGTLSLSLTRNVTVDSDHFILTAQNTSGQSFSGGTFSLYKTDGSSGLRTLVYQTNLSGILLHGESETMIVSSDSLLTTNTTFLLIYKGTIGFASGVASDPVDAGIAIAAKTFGVYANDEFIYSNCIGYDADGNLIFDYHTVPAGSFYSPISVEDAIRIASHWYGLLYPGICI